MLLTRISVEEKIEKSLLFIVVVVFAVLALVQFVVD